MTTPLEIREVELRSRNERCSSSLVFRKGLDLKDAVAAELNQNYHSDLVQQIKADDFQYRSGRLTIHLAREFGFCYGVDRAVDYAYQTRERFPDRRVFLTGEIIHNPHVNDRLRGKGIQFLSDADRRPRAAGPDDVVVLPAFGVTTAEMQRFSRDRLRDGRYDLRLGAERLEERQALRAGRLHVDHSRQGVARGNAGDRVAGARPSPTAASSSS